MEYCINENCSIKEALKRIDEESFGAYTLFVITNDEKILGTLTDGDIRRFLISDGLLSDTVSKAMHRDFCYLDTHRDIVLQLNSIKRKGIKLLPVLSDKGIILNIIDIVNYKSHLPVDAVLMAGGKGERLRPLTEKTPKPLLLVGDKAIIDHNVERLISYGLKHISVTVNYLKEQLEQHFVETKRGIKIKTVTEPKYMGTIGAIQFVKEFYNDTILVMNSDLLTDLNYEDFYLHFKKHNADMSIAAVPYAISIPFGIMDLDGRNIKGMQEKPCFNYYANAGIYLIKREMLDNIPRDIFYNATDLIDDLIRQNKTVIRYPINGTWIDIGNPQEYQKANDLARHMKFNS